MIIDDFNSVLFKVRRRTRRAFTLIEMLVVISVIVVVLAIVVPSVARLMRSTNYASAISAVTATLGRARAAAMESGRPTAVAFLFDIETEQYTLQTLELAPAGNTGSFWESPSPLNPNCGEDLSSSGSNGVVVYQALRFSSPIELPPGMGVFGLSQMIPELDADPLFFDTDSDTRIDPIAESLNGQDFDIQQWYAGEIINDGDGSGVFPDNNIIPWIFPRSDPRLYINQGDDPWLIMSQEQSGNINAARAAVRHAMSFAVAFRPDGSVSTTFGDFASSMPDAYIEFTDDMPLDELLENPTPYDRRSVFDPGCLHPTMQEETQPNPEVRLRTASQLAVVDLRSLQAGAGVNEPWLVRSEQSLAPIPTNSSDPKLRFQDDSLVVSMSRWIDENAQIIGFNRYTGETVKR